MNIYFSVDCIKYSDAQVQHLTEALYKIHKSRVEDIQDIMDLKRLGQILDELYTEHRVILDSNNNKRTPRILEIDKQIARTLCNISWLQLVEENDEELLSGLVDGITWHARLISKESEKEAKQEINKAFVRILLNLN